MPAPFPYAICNEIFKDWSLDQTCAAISGEGYGGVEIAPFTLAGNPVDLPASERDQVKQIIARHNLQFAGLHWLLAAPEGLHATSRDESQRKHTWNFLHRLIDLASDLRTLPSHQPVLVFGSPKQRATMAGVSRSEAVAMMTEGLNDLAPHAQERNVLVLLEPLSADQCDVITSLSEAVAIVEQIDSPAIQTMFDVHNAIDESTAHPELIRRYSSHIRHIHVNEMDGREPGAGNYNFGALLQTLHRVNYRGWISLEAFDFERDPVQISRNSLAYLKQLVTPPSLAQTL